MQVQTVAKLTTALTIGTLLTLVACDRKASDDRTVGQKLDSTLSKVERKADEAMDKTKSAGNEAMDAAARQLSDAAITTKVNAALTGDSTLSPLLINVDTNAGRVTLNGTVGNDLDRERVTQLARRVEGVVDVDNKLQVKN